MRFFFFPLMQYTGMMLLEEMASIFLTPYLLIFVVPKVVYFFNRFIIIFFCTINASFWTDSPISILQRVDDILQFIADSTVNVEGVGHVCKLVFLLCSDLLFWHGSTLVAFFYMFLNIDNIFIFSLLYWSFGSFSVFDFQKHGNSNYGSPHNAPRTERSSQGKMEKSFLRYDRGYISCR